VDVHHGYEAKNQEQRQELLANSFLPTWRAKYRSGFMTLPSVLLQEQPAVVLLWGRALASWSLAMNECGGHQDLRGLDRRSIIPYVHGRTGLYCTSLPCLSFFYPCEVAHARAFYTSWSGSYNESQGLIGGLGAGQTLCCGAQWLGVVNDVFNGVGMPDLVAYHPALGQWYGVVPLHH
jgi:hypothetical protein